VAEPIEIPFRVWTRVSQRNHVLHGVSIHPCEGAILRGKHYLTSKWLAERARSGPCPVSERLAKQKFSQWGFPVNSNEAEIFFAYCSCLANRSLSGQHPAILLQRNPSVREMPDQVHFSLPETMLESDKI